MNSFEQFTLIIGALAVAIEAFKHFKDKLKGWLNTES
jgi:hypothetical protein